MNSKTFSEILTVMLLAAILALVFGLYTVSRTPQSVETAISITSDCNTRKRILEDRVRLERPDVTDVVWGQIVVWDRECQMGGEPFPQPEEVK